MSGFRVCVFQACSCLECGIALHHLILRRSPFIIAFDFGRCCEDLLLFYALLLDSCCGWRVTVAPACQHCVSARSFEENWHATFLSSLQERHVQFLLLLHSFEYCVPSFVATLPSLSAVFAGESSRLRSSRSTIQCTALWQAMATRLTWVCGLPLVTCCLCA